MRDADRRSPGSADRDTIAAIATAPGRAGIGVIRVSGPQATGIAQAVAGRVPQPRTATLCVFRDAHGERIDQGIALYFPAPGSYTGEPVLEFQGHGGTVVLHALLGACLDAGARIAEPGEFTRRAFLEGRLDLAQAEAVSDLIDAGSREAARSAMRSLTGEFSQALNRLAAGLLELRALTEAMLDFPEEEVDAVHRDDAVKRVGRLQEDLAGILDRSRRGSVLRSGAHVVLAGAPNVGKSSLLNRLAGQDRAIVTPLPGTTRDALREAVDIDGVPVVIVDTAGVRESIDEIERLGIERAHAEVARADVILLVRDAGGAESEDERTLRAHLPERAACIRVRNKIDLAGAPEADPETVFVSAKTGEGIDALRRAILERLGWTVTGESAFLARERHLRALAAASRHLEGAQQQVGRWELFAEELRLAHQALGEITGATVADDVLGEIFARFCLGK